MNIPTYRGNRGNLLQHWVLVEVLGCVRQKDIDKLCFIDAYSMSPTPMRSPKAATDPTAPEFDRTRSRLTDEGSEYELAWLHLSQALPSEYPSSAAFVRHCWRGWTVVNSNESLDGDVIGRLPRYVRSTSDRNFS